MRKTLLLLFVVCIAPLFLFGQQIQSFDTVLDTVNYFGYEQGDDAADSISYIRTSLVTEGVQEGEGALQLEYSVHNSQSFGGFAKIEYVVPDSGIYDWSQYDSISFWYNNTIPQNVSESVHLRFNLYEVSDVADTTSDATEMEFYYSFHYVLDNVPGWNEIKMPLLDGRGVPGIDEWNGGGFNRTGWSGIPGNDVLNTDKIKGWAFEFSIGGNGAGNHTTGTITLDNFSLKGSKSVLPNGGFENGLTGWGDNTGGGYVSLNTEDSYNGLNSLELGVNHNSWTVAFSDNLATVAGHEILLGAWIKDISDGETGGDFAALKIEAKNSSGDVVRSIETVAPGITADWSYFSTTLIMPEDADSMTAVLVGSKWAGNDIPATYLFDDVVLIDLGVSDTLGAIAVTGVSAVAGEYVNQVIWQDVPGEEGETYDVYASESPIVNRDDAGVIRIATGIAEGVQTVLDRLVYPLVDTEITMYYAVAATDRADNEGELGSSSSGILNIAEGIPTISLDPPAGFVADGDLTEWNNSSIVPFEFIPSISHVGFGSFDNDDDYSATAWVAIDDNYLYFAVDVLDNIHSYGPGGDWWNDDVVELYIGLYNQTSIHNGFLRGAQPDYKINFTETGLRVEQVSGTEYFTVDSANYSYVVTEPDFTIEARIPLDHFNSGNASDDSRFHPVNGTRIPLDIVFHDSDADNVTGGLLSFSPFSNDNSWQGVQNWFHSWIGDTNAVVVTAIDDKTGYVAGSYELGQNYPNPFNPLTSIKYSIAKASNVRISIYNVLGQEVDVLVDTKQASGSYKVTFNGAKYSSGVYFYKLKAGSFEQVRKMMIIK